MRQGMPPTWTGDDGLDRRIAWRGARRGARGRCCSPRLEMSQKATSAPRCLATAALAREGVGARGDLVAGPDAEGLEGEEEARGGGVDREGALGSDEGGELLLEGSRDLAGREPARAEDLEDGASPPRGLSRGGRRG